MHKLAKQAAMAAATLLAACSGNTVFQQSADIPDAVWQKDNVVEFTYESADTTARYDVVIDIRNLNNYPNQNFWLFANLYSPQGDLYCDTLNCVLADNNGRWLGKGMGSVHHLPVMFLQNVNFPQKGKYRFELIQGMRTDALPGICDIGVRIEPATDKSN